MDVGERKPGMHSVGKVCRMCLSEGLGRETKGCTVKDQLVGCLKDDGVVCGVEAWWWW